MIWPIVWGVLVYLFVVGAVIAAFHAGRMIVVLRYSGGNLVVLHEFRIASFALGLCLFGSLIAQVALFWVLR